MAECSGGSETVPVEKSSEAAFRDMKAGSVQYNRKEEVQEELYEVEKIVGTTKINGRLLYKVRWRGYSPNWDTFEPEENLQTCLDLIDDFKSRREQLKQQRTLERRRRKALMEGRILPESVDCDNKTSTSTGVTVPGSHMASSVSDPDTLKDTFWRDLEEGKVNLFETDMYSKVKGQGRASRPTSFKPESQKGKDEEEDEDSDHDKRRSNKGRSKNSRRSRAAGQKSARAQQGGRKRKSKVKKKSQKIKAETAFDRAQLDCHNGISTPESLCSMSSNSRSSLLYTDVCSGKTVKSPVSLTSELMVKVERIHVGQEMSSPALTPDIGLGTDSNSNSNSGESSDNVNLNSNTAGLREDIARSESDSSPDKTESIAKPADYPNLETTENSAAARMVPKRPSVCTESTLGGKKMRTGESNTASAHTPADEAASVLRGDYHGCTETSGESRVRDKTAISATCISETDLHGVSCTTSNNTTGATPHSINSTISVTSPSYSDKSDVACIQSTISEGSDLESSCRGDKFSDTSPPTDSGEDCMKGDDEANSYSGILEINAEQFDSEVSRMKANSQGLEITERKFQDAVSEGDYETVKKALSGSKQYNLDAIDATGMTLLMYAAQRGYDDIVELLVSHGSRINAQQRNGTTALMLACEHSALHTVILLVELGATLNLQQTSGETALMKAVKRGSPQIVTFLLERGANFASQTITGNSAMTYAKMLHVCDVEDILFDHVARLTAEFDRQVAVTINNTAKIMCALFPLQCFPLCDGNKFVIHFKHELQPITPGVGYLLFVAHTRITHQEIKCRFYGPCAVTTVMLNGVLQPSLTQVGMKAEANFVLSCCPLNNGKNELVINTTASPTSKSKLVICAYKAKLME
ncbi:M-phase phosphoprotein 8-like isoform X2 [Liolophura sinensis]|uniref:M-phase phosphoprotein 8-like isoform X2 n=1 Tax=Liolophura sinensis TaxID=3198878 RepID=UPI0031596FF7